MTLALGRTVSRNDPCPCGSGRRYKDCHGSRRAGAQPAATPLAPRTSAYRAPGDDWSGLDEATRDRLGAIMERALQEQLAQRVRDAERLYRSVLEQAPQTHDALHMLGVIRLGLGDFTDAEQLIRRAMALRPEYPAIVTNWSLVRRAIAARDRRGVEILCEHALPLLFGSLGARRATGEAESARPANASACGLPLVAPTQDPTGDAGWLASRLRELLAPLRVQCWNGGPESGLGWQPLARHRIDVSTGSRPHGERVALVGLESDAESWLREPIDSVLVFVQRSKPSLALERLRRIAADGARSLTLVFDSNAKARRFGMHEHVLPPPLTVVSDPATNDARGESDALRVATIGQDGLHVAVADDADHLRLLAECAGELRILDPGPLRFALGASRFVACVPRDAASVAALVASSDVFLQRSAAWWSEDPRPMLTAMALGVPAVCPRASVYAEYVDDANDGWLYDDDAHALRLIAMLRDDRSGVRAAGALAQAKVRALLEPRRLASRYCAVVEQWVAGP
jgi:glycosyltransferase involved in cell wall biosynthesis